MKHTNTSATHGRPARPALRRSMLALLAGAIGLAAAPVFAQGTDNFPNRAVTIVVPFPAGGATDITARLVAEGLSKKWGQPVVVENKPGAGGNVGSEYVARAAPDGYTLVLGVTGSHGINTSLYKNMRYDPVKDFEAITQATLYPNAIIVNNDVPANNLQELIALLKKPDAHYSYGSDGNGTASHLGMELIKNQGKFEIAHIPYRGLPAVQAYAKSGKLKIVALTTAGRFASAPDYPTVAEQGFPGYAAPPWSGFFAPKGTPKPLVEKISADMREVMADPKTKEKLAASGSEFTPSTPEQFQAFVQQEIAKWAEAVKISGARID
jgi:tripartite-type tricarboxylate transporter receptor subunit TctC